MGRPKGGKNRSWPKEEKLRIVNRYQNEGIGSRELAKEENVESGMLRRWIRKYLEHGESAFENQKKTGNRFAALHTSKTLSELDQLRLTVAKQEIEIERLKKGYLVKGDGSGKAFVITSDVNLKSSID